MLKPYCDGACDVCAEAGAVFGEVVTVWWSHSLDAGAFDEVAMMW